MPTLYPPDYPYLPEAPLASFGLSFSEELARSIIRTLIRTGEDEPEVVEVRVASGLTMLEAFHPRDHLECMIAAQGVAMHAAIMDDLARAMDPDIKPELAVKFRANSVQLARAFWLNVQGLERRQAKPLPERPAAPPPAPPSGPPAPPSGPAAAEPALPAEDTLPDDVKTRPDGTPGSLADYAPKPPEIPFVPHEAPINLALATRPKPYRIVNAPGGSSPPPAPKPAEPEPVTARFQSNVDLRTHLVSGDALARFASTRLDPNAPDPPLFRDDDHALIELEIISTGGDPELEAYREALAKADPEGRPISRIEYGSARPMVMPVADDPDDDEDDGDGGG